MIENFYITYFNHLINRQKNKQNHLFLQTVLPMFYNLFANISNNTAISGFANSQQLNQKLLIRFLH